MLSFHSFAWTISQVCHVWRRIALECSTLWNMIRIPSYSLLFSNTHRGSDPLGWDCHVTGVQVRRAIRRMKEAELRIS